MQFLYTIRGKFDATFNGWTEYIRWSKLYHLDELVSVDTSLNEVLVQPPGTNKEDWNFIHFDGNYETGFFTTIEYVLNRFTDNGKFNFLAIVINPHRDCKLITPSDFEFIGYDLLDKYYSTSALTNCGGFDETFSPTVLNNKGLIDEFAIAYDLHKKLLLNNPIEHHADTNVIAIWRHKTIGR